MKILRKLTVALAGLAVAVAPITGAAARPPNLPPPPPPPAPPCNISNAATGPATGIMSDWFYGPYEPFSDTVAADFTPTVACLPASIDVPGQYFGPDKVDYVQVRFYWDTGGLPSSIINAQGWWRVDDGAGNFHIPLGSFAFHHFEAGVKYWVSVRAVMPQYSQTIWTWRQTMTQTGGPAVYAEPANGMGRNCLTWKPAPACGWGGGTDVAFTLS